MGSHAHDSEDKGQDSRCSLVKNLYFSLVSTHHMILTSPRRSPKIISRRSSSSSTRRSSPSSTRRSSPSSPRRSTVGSPQRDRYRWDSNMLVKCRTRVAWTFPRLELYGWKVDDKDSVCQRRAFVMTGPVETKELVKKAMRAFLTKLHEMGFISSFRIKGKGYRMNL